MLVCKVSIAAVLALACFLGHFAWQVACDEASKAATDGSEFDS